MNKHERRHVVYISGPMTGIKDFNYPAFAQKSQELRRCGFVVINPAVTGEEDTSNLESVEWHDYMISAIDRMRKATALYQMRGWWRSYGAWVEFIVARKMKLRMIK